MKTIYKTNIDKIAALLCNKIIDVKVEISTSLNNINFKFHWLSILLIKYKRRGNLNAIEKELIFLFIEIPFNSSIPYNRKKELV